MAWKSGSLRVTQPLNNFHGELIALSSPAEILAAAEAVGDALISCHAYAPVGGGACVALGSTRATQDIDIVVPQGQTAATRRLFRASPHFSVDPRTNHTRFKEIEAVSVEILTPPLLFKEPFDKTTEVVKIGNLRVLKPALLLNAKCGSIRGRSSEHKRGTDAMDILFLLEYRARNRMNLPEVEEVPNATKEFVADFVRDYGGEDLWVRAGYDLEIGSF